MVVNRRSDDFLWHEIEKALDPLVAVEHAAGRAQAQHKLLIARGAETGLERRTFIGLLEDREMFVFPNAVTFVEF